MAIRDTFSSMRRRGKCLKRAGMPFELYYFDANEEDFMMNYRIGIHDEPPENMKVIFGHTPSVHYNGKLPAEIRKAGSFVNIDCGAGYPKGRLACLRLDDMKVFYSD